MVTSAALERPLQTPSSPHLAIVIPTLDEAETLARNLPLALDLADQVIVSDGGSRDPTLDVAQRLGARTVTGPPGRGTQLNRGARACRAEIMLFLHADTILPCQAAEAIRDAIANGAVGGGFHVEFDDPRPLLRLGNRLVAARTRWTKTPLGDQAQFVRADAFRELGGFREWPILEDLDFARRLRRYGRIVILPGPATTAARRFVQQGIVRTVVGNWLIWALFFAGVSPHRLAKLYRVIR